MAMTTTNTPKLRFPDFSVPWKAAVLGDVATFSKGKGISKADISEAGKTPCIRYGELYTYYGTSIDQTISYTDVARSELHLSEGNEVIVPASGEAAKDIATAAVVLRKGVALGGDLNVIRSKQDGLFLASYLSGKKRMTLASMAQGHSVVHLYPTQLQTLELAFPSLPEQKEISSFLSSVDIKISQLGKKKALLEEYKNGIMLQLFTQVVRFKAENGEKFPDWEEKRLVDIASRVTERNSDRRNNRVLTNSAEMGVVDQRDFFDNDVANKANHDVYYIMRKGDFVYNPRISNLAPVGPIRRNNIGVGIISPLYTVFRIKSGVVDFFNQYFLSSVWHSYMESVANYGARHDRMAISMRDFMDMPIPFPDIEEQYKIANFLSAIDRKVDLVTTELDNAKAFKKGLLQHMFV